MSVMPITAMAGIVFTIIGRLARSMASPRMPPPTKPAGTEASSLYCTPHRGYEVGKTGATYRQSCPPASEATFLRGYDYGRALYQEQQRVADLQRDIRAYEDKLRKASDVDGRESLRRRIRDLDDELALVRRHMRRLQEDAAASGFY